MGQDKAIEAMRRVSKGVAPIRDLWLVVAVSECETVDVLGVFSNEDDAQMLFAMVQDETSEYYAPLAEIQYIELNTDYFGLLGQKVG